MPNLNITTDPQGAWVYIDGADTRQITPTTLDLLEGKHFYLLRNQGYEDISGIVDIAAGNSYILNAAMQSMTVAMEQNYQRSMMTLGYLGIAVSVGLAALAWIFSARRA